MGAGLGPGRHRKPIGGLGRRQGACAKRGVAGKNPDLRGEKILPHVGIGSCVWDFVLAADVEVR